VTAAALPGAPVVVVPTLTVVLAGQVAPVTPITPLGVTVEAAGTLTPGFAFPVNPALLSTTVVVFVIEVTE
jgi:hypothetical protein